MSLCENSTVEIANIESKMTKDLLFKFLFEIYFRKLMIHSVLDACRTQITDVKTLRSHIETSNICGSNGACVADGFENFACRCSPGFTGKFCQNSKSNH